MQDLNAALESFYFAHRALTAWPDKILEKHGLSRGHHRILFFVARNPGLSINDLLAKLGVCKQSVNAPLRKLLEMGFVASEQDKSDKRIKQLTLTRSGRKLEEELTNDQRRRLTRAFNAAGDNAMSSWSKVLQELAR